MPARLPQQSDFPSTLTLSITPPPPPPSSPSTQNSTTPPPQNALILLHGLGDTLAPFASLAQALKLPETVIIAVQAPRALPFGLGPGWHWGDDLTFDAAAATGSASGTGANGTMDAVGAAVDVDGGFEGARRVIGDVVIRQGLVQRCGFVGQRVLIYGFGQGGMVGLAVACGLNLRGGAGDNEHDGGTAAAAAAAASAGGNKDRATQALTELGGVVSVGGALPADVQITDKGKSKTPVLILGGSSRSLITTSAMRRIKDAFDYVQVHQFRRPGDTMPSNRDEMLPIMQFFARRLRSRAGVPDGAVELA